MLRRALSSFSKFNSITFKGRATFFGQQPNFDTSKDYYLTLGVSKQANENEIKNAYYKLAKIHHPDHSQGNDRKFKQISQAYQVLSDKNRRKQYDAGRTFSRFTSNASNKAYEGQYNYQQYNNMYQSMSAEQQQQVRQRMRLLGRKIFITIAGLFLFWMLFTRRPHIMYQQVNGQLIPISNEQLRSIYMQSAHPQMEQQMPMYGSPYQQAQPYNYNPNPYQQSSFQPMHAPQYQQQANPYSNYGANSPR